MVLISLFPALTPLHLIIIIVIIIIIVVVVVVVVVVSPSTKNAEVK
jgi:hypothetical protein